MELAALAIGLVCETAKQEGDPASTKVEGEEDTRRCLPPSHVFHDKCTHAHIHTLTYTQKLKTKAEAHHMCNKTP